MSQYRKIQNTCVLISSRSSLFTSPKIMKIMKKKDKKMSFKSNLIPQCIVKFVWMSCPLGKYDILHSMSTQNVYHLHSISIYPSIRMTRKSNESVRQSVYNINHTHGEVSPIDKNHIKKLTANANWHKK